MSTPALDALVDALVAIDGVIGARLTGAGFGGCVVALVERGTPIDAARPTVAVAVGGHPRNAATARRRS